MNFDPASFEDTHLPLVRSLETAIENTVVQTIVLGSGGPENKDTTDAGLRFVRHLLANCRTSKYGFMPNLKDMNNIRSIAQEFIRHCGNGPLALETMYQVMQLPS